ncbi:unnamed protein product [Discula destructiva]
MDVRRKSQDAASRALPPPRPRRPSASLPSVPLVHPLDSPFAHGLSDRVREIVSTSPPGTGAGPPVPFAIPRTTSAATLRNTAYRPGLTSPTTPANPQAATTATTAATAATTTTTAVTPDPTDYGAQHGLRTNTISDDTPSAASGAASRAAGASIAAASGADDGAAAASALPIPVARGLTSMSPPTSPPPPPGSTRPGFGSTGSNASTPAGARRQGIVFNDAFSNSFDTVSSSPPPRPAVRPRGHTMDASFRQSSVTSPVETSRHRMGSVSSNGSMSSMPSHHEEVLRGPPVPRHSPALESPGYPAVYHSRPVDLHIQTGPVVKDKRTSTRAKLMKRASRPTSPMLSPPHAGDSLPLPVPTDDANKILCLMKYFCGRMRGHVAYQADVNGPRHTGLAYIQYEKGCLMFDSSDTTGPSHTAIVPDLRGCRVLPVDRPGLDRPCLEIASPQSGVELRLWPLKADEMDLWLAALLCWQQVQPSTVRLPRSQSSTPISQTSPDFIRRNSSTASTAPNVIKVSIVSFWDKGVASTPQAILKRISTRDLRMTAQTGWRKISCILYDNGEVKLMNESDGTTICIIQLSQLSRCAIQKLDKSVLDEEFCIATFPLYALTATQLSLFRPVFLSFDHRTLFEVWFVLLRAFTMPEVYALDEAEEDEIMGVTDLDMDPTSDMFRVEKTISLRVIEAKLGGPTSPHTSSMRDRLARTEQDMYVGNYFAEVMLDGEIRARTISKLATRTPFWRDDCEFVDLPGDLPSLSVRLKRIDGDMDGMTHQMQAYLSLLRSGALTETICGYVDIPLHQLDRGKDHEEWRQILDSGQRFLGTMLCKVRHEELVVFMARDYQPLSEMLHKFSSGLTKQVSEALPGQLRRLAEIFLNIFQVTKSTSDWLMALVEDEIDGIGQQTHLKKMRNTKRLQASEALDVANANEREALRDMGKALAGEANLLFRGNSLLTQALEFHMRRLGTDYIEDILGDKIFEINEINPNCEVDPGKLQPGEDLDQHWDQLLQFTNEIWECVARSASKFPPELRHILKYIRAVADDRYGDFLRTVAFTSVSGFLFLRFICPAILNPKLFGLLRDYPRPRAQRTLTLIAKALQALANLSNIGKKEVWMEPMNRFLSSRRQGLKDFIDDVCAIPAERDHHVLPPSYSTPVAILGRLPPLAREGFPSLPYLVDPARNFASLVRLWTDHSKSTTSEPRYDGDVLKFHRHCLALQQRADLCMDRMDLVRADHENTSQPTDSNTDPTEQVSLTDLSINTVSKGSSSTTPWIDHEPPPGSSGGSSVDEERPHKLRSHKYSDRHKAARANKYPTSDTADCDPSCHHRQKHGRPANLKTIRSGNNAKKFIVGIMRRLDRDRDRTGSPENASSSGQSQSGSAPHVVSGSSDGKASGDSRVGGATTPTGTMRQAKEKRGLAGGFGNLVDGFKDLEAGRH